MRYSIQLERGLGVLVRGEGYGYTNDDNDDR
jgi:hypothetical protein